MSFRVFALVAVVLAATALVGCQQPAQRVADLSGDGVHLFGATPVPLGQEGVSHFAYVPPAEAPLLMFDHRSAYVHSYTYEIEDNRRPGRSHHRRRTRTEETYFFAR